MKKRNFLWLTGMFMLVMLSFASCGDDDEGIDGNANELIVGTWQSTRSYGYDIYDGEREDYDEPYTGDQYSFSKNGTGTYTDLETSNHDGYSFRWAISGNSLILDGGTTEEERYTIAKLNDNELELEYSGKEDGDEWYYKEVYKRVN